MRPNYPEPTPTFFISLQSSYFTFQSDYAHKYSWKYHSCALELERLILMITRKCKKVLKYIQGTIGLPFILSTDRSVNVKWYVDAASAVQKDMQSHTGGFMTMVTEGVYFQSIKKKNIKISTDAKLVRVVNVLTQVIWTR